MANLEAKSVEVKDIKNQTEISLQKFEDTFKDIKDIKDFVGPDGKKMSLIKQKQDGIETVYVYTHMTPEEYLKIKSSKAKVEANDSCGPLESSSSLCTVYQKNPNGAITTQTYKRVLEESAESERFNLGRIRSFWAVEDYSNQGFPVELVEPKQIETAMNSLKKAKTSGAEYLAKQVKKNSQNIVNNNNKKMQEEDIEKDLDHALASI